ncbi:hypothetical protein A3J90_01300 [candidate division WOR-1 bacterium RIFOXYC2_FULL_37_10]|nr:MAG: hypothetical protein A3J90_01300 [candidate division WOR-1 bacterium RIFOXYC2_FULL_37_10]
MFRKMTTLLFLHGFATGSAIWDAQVKEFSKDFNVTTDAEKIDELENVVIVAWSMGGWKAFKLCNEYPQKVKGLVLVSSFAKYLKSNDYPYGVNPALLRKLERKFMADYKEGMRYFYRLIFGNSDHDYLIEKLPAHKKEDFALWFERLKKEDFRSFLPQIKIPTLLIHGNQDNVVPVESSKYMNSQISNSKLEIFKGAGHAPFIEKADKFRLLLKQFIE